MVSVNIAITTLAIFTNIELQMLIRGVLCNKLNIFEMESAIKNTLQKIEEAFLKRPTELQEYIKPRLVAVSKTKPKEAVLEAYQYGQRHFGENYVQELLTKGHDSEIISKCKDIEWHFIGNLQSNKIPKVVQVPNLAYVETIHSDKLATSLNRAWKNANPDKKLKVFVQINTSGEEQKGGISPDDAAELVQHIKTNCDALDLAGIMTIGKYGYDVSLGPNPDFLKLVECRTNICTKLNLDPKTMELSMGMSSDFEHAVELGSSNVRVGTSIFGDRDYGQKS